MKSKIVTSLVLAGCMSASNVLAAPLAEISEISENQYGIKISKNIDSEDLGKKINIVVLNPGKTVEDIGVDTDALQMQNALKAENENFSYIFPLHLDDVNDTGVYKVRIKVEGKTAEECEVYFASNADRKGFIERINNAQSHMELYGVLEDAKIALSYDNELYNSINKDKLSQMMYEDIQKNKLDTENISKATNQVKEYIITEAFNEGLMSGLFDGKYEFLNKEIVKLETIDVNGADIYKTVYSEVLNEKGKKLVAESLMNNEYKNISELKSDFATFTMMYAITNSSKSGSGHVSKILTEKNAKVTGIDILKYLEIQSSTKKALIDDELMSKTYSKLSDVEGFIDTAIKNLPKDKPSGSGGSSGGSGGGSVAITVPSNVTIENQGTEQKNETFNDLEGYDWAKDAILYMHEKGYVNGVSEGKFAPEKNITREQFVVILLRAFEEELTAEGDEFSDVLLESYYEKYVNTAYKRGIVNGIGGGMFGVGQNVSRQDFVTMIYRALKNKGIELKENKSIVQFTDNEQIADYAKEAVEKLVRAGAVNGFSDGTFNPTGLCTRAQAAKVIYEIVKEG